MKRSRKLTKALAAVDVDASGPNAAALVRLLRATATVRKEGHRARLRLKAAKRVAVEREELQERLRQDVHAAAVEAGGPQPFLELLNRKVKDGALTLAAAEEFARLLGAPKP